MIDMRIEHYLKQIFYNLPVGDAIDMRKDQHSHVISPGAQCFGRVSS